MSSAGRELPEPGPLASEFLSKVEGRLGRIARPDGGFFSYKVASTAVQRLRVHLVNGGAITYGGERWAAGAAAYLAWIVERNWTRRGFAISKRERYEEKGASNMIGVVASRTREGRSESYGHDFFADMKKYLLLPPKALPTLHGQYYVLTSLSLPEPEYLYLYGAALTQSPLSDGNWPRGTKTGGLEEDFKAARALLVDDLHADCGLPLDDPGLRELSWWLVFPPYGYQMNDGQDYNLMTLFSSVLHKKVVPAPRAESYLRALLTSQCYFLRNLAARALMVLGLPPKTPQESLFYFHALNASDHAEARAAMNKYQWQIEGRGDPKGMTRDWAAEAEEKRRALAAAGPREAWRSAPVLRDPEYNRLAEFGWDRVEEQKRALAPLLERYPNDWFVMTAWGGALMASDRPKEGEDILRGLLAEQPGCPTAHSVLGTLLKRQGRRDEALRVYEEAIRLWPWDAQLVDACMWLLTDGMVGPAPPTEPSP